MAIYRSDQAQVTFAVEAAPGGSPELASVVTANTTPAVANQLASAPTIVGIPTGGLVDVGTHFYKIAFWNSNDNILSEAGAASLVATTTASNKTVSLASIDTSGPVGTTDRFVYRTVTNAAVDSVYFLVPGMSTLVTGTSGTTALDTFADSTLTTQAPPSGHIIAGADGVPAGSRSIAVGSGFANSPLATGADTADSSHFIVGDHIQIGPTTGFAGTAVTKESEVRRVEFIDGTSLVLDRPTSFHHENECHVQRITAITDTALDKYITFVPGVYETVEVPDPQMAIEPRYYLGTASKRNPYQFLSKIRKLVAQSSSSSFDHLYSSNSFSCISVSLPPTLQTQVSKKETCHIRP